jgi:hypothetical protein
MARPTEYNTELRVNAAEAKEAISATSFTSESALCSFLEVNIEAFCKDHLGSSLEDYKREFSIGPTVVKMGWKAPRIDFYVSLTNGSFVGIECKGGNIGRHQLIGSISQLLGYAVSAERHGVKIDRLMLVLGVYNQIVYEIVETYSLPIEVVFLSKEHIIKYGK